MTTIKDLARQGSGPARAGSRGAWRREVTPIGGGTLVRIFHYRTEMLVYVEKPDGSTMLVDYDEGNGSVSDQGGMNTLFKAAGLPFYYSRKGGAVIREVSQ